MTYQRHGLCSLQECLGDLLVYRSLRPVDRRLPSLSDLHLGCGVPPGTVPRKAEPGFGRVVAEMLRSARQLDLAGARIRRLVYLGDTRMNDGIAFRNLCVAGDWAGWAFIGRDDLSQPRLTKVEDGLYLANRWSALPGFFQFLERERFALDAETALVVDVDKTLIGARGRNDRLIDEARVEAVQHTVGELLGTRFDAAAFRSLYDELNQPAYHAFTEDNQDYLAYVCLMLCSGLFSLGALLPEARSGSLRFAEWVARVETRREELSATGLMTVHDQIRDRMRSGDPTPFKAFRHHEYLTTAARFGDVPGAAVEHVLTQRICITAEVVRAIHVAQRAGALVFGLSDKPDEAASPGEEQAKAGLLPLERLETACIGEAH